MLPAAQPGRMRPGLVLTGQASDTGGDRQRAGASHTSCQSNLIVFLEYTVSHTPTLGTREAHESSKNNESKRHVSANNNIETIILRLERVILRL